jgi:hypothetical protein
VSAKRHFVAAVALLVGLLVVPAGARAERFDPESLDRLLAPVALYPDSLLGNILLASTWPTQIQAAHQWVESHPGRSLQEVADAVEGSAWDPSVQMLVLVPDVLAMMAQDMGWTAALGQAFSNQTSDLYDSIQRLRKRARATGSLVNTQTVRVVTDEDGLISIGSVNPNVLLVPRYTPAVVYGWDPGSVVLRTALVWGTVYLLDRAFYGTCWDWHRRRFWWGPGYGTCGYWNGSFRPFGPGSRFEPMRPHLMHRPPSWHVGMGSPAGVRPHGVPSRPSAHRPEPHRPTRPSGERPDSTRPTRPSGERPDYTRPTRPSGERPDYTRPTRPSGERPDSTRPTRPSGEPPDYTRPTRPSGERPDYSRPSRPSGEGSGFSRPTRPSGEARPSRPSRPSGEGSGFSRPTRPSGEARPSRPSRPSGEGSGFSRPTRPSGEARPSRPSRPSGEGSGFSRPSRPSGEARPSRPSRPSGEARPSRDRPRARR